MPTAAWRSPWAMLALAALPLALVLGLISNRHLFEPFFQLRNIDPAYAYLMNAMTLLCGHTPRHIDHPGTTLQMLGAVVIGAMNLLRGISPVCPAADVFTRPEAYLAGIGMVLQVAIGVVLFALPARLYVLTGNLIAGLAIQASFLTSVTVVSQLVRVQPDVLLMPVVLGFGLALLPLGLQARPELPRDAIVSGAILGFGLATKVTILPLFLFVFMFGTIKAKVRFALTCFGAFVLCTIPVLSMNMRFFGWIINVAGHSGHYGEGEIGLPPLAHMVATALNLIVWHKTEFFCAFVALALAVMLWRQRSRLDPTVRFLLIGVVVLIAQLGMTTKHPAPHYMIPALLVMAVVSGVAAAVLGRMRSRYAAGFLVLLLAVGAYPVWQNWQYLRFLPKSYAAEQSANARIRKIAAQECGKLIYQDSNSDVQFALRFGDAFTEGRFRFRLAQIYPDFLLYNRGDDTFYNFSTYLGRDMPASAGDKPSCLLGTGKLPEGGARGIRRLATEGDFNLYAVAR
jgi:hypothetical protein